MLPSVASSVDCPIVRAETPTRPASSRSTFDPDLRIAHVERGADVAHARHGARHLGDRARLLVERLQLLAAYLEDEGRDVPVGEDAGDEAAGRLQELDAGEVARRGAGANDRRARCCESLRCSGSVSASRMKPMCGPQLGLVMALRALLGEPTLVSTSSTVPSGSSFESRLPISIGHVRRLLERGARREADVDALHRFVDLGEERARQSRGDEAASARRAPPRRRSRPQRKGRTRAQQLGVAVGEPIDGALDPLPKRPARRGRGSSGRPPA